MTAADTGLVVAARALAIKAHRGQVDKVGESYIRHPARVARRVQSLGPEHEAVAWLHDVIEDCGWTADRLRAEGFPEPVVRGVVAMTKQVGDTGEGPVRRACGDPIARIVKAADVADNTDPARQAVLPPEERERLAAKYDAYRRVLDDHGAPTFERHVELSPDELL